jgi:hypothetical protein
MTIWAAISAPARIRQLRTKNQLSLMDVGRPVRAARLDYIIALAALHWLGFL